MTQAPQNSYGMFEQINTGPIWDDLPSDEDVDMAEVEPTIEESDDRLIIAIDFGTTFSSVAYTRTTDASRADQGSIEVKCISNYPEDRPPPASSFGWEPREEVPTELWYNLDSSYRNAQPEDGGGQRFTEQLSNVDPADADSSSDFSDSDDDFSNEPTREQEYAVQDSTVSDNLLWGYGVQSELKKMDIQKESTRRLSRFKLMLDECEETAAVRTEIEPVLKKLRTTRVIRQNTDVIRDYLEQLLKHTRDQLQSSREYDANLHIEFVLCIPAVWPTKALLAMQAVMNEAVQRSGLVNLRNNDLDLFIVSEPEAAATCVLAEENNDIYEGEIIIILDAGGGTVDAVTYQVNNSFPLRLSAEVVSPCTELCGGSYINEEYKTLLLERLKDEIYLEKNGKTIKSIVEGKVIEFENGEKRIFDIRNETFRPDAVSIDYLTPNPDKNLHQNRLFLTRNDLKGVFKKSLKGTAKLLKNQLDLAKENGHSVSKVILTGGFGQSPSLRSYLRRKIAKERNFLGHEITFLTPRTPSTAVARGAVLRALNKERGPDRITMCSYGFLQTEPHEPDEYPEHVGVRPKKDKVDGIMYIHSTINWLIQKGDSLPHNKEISITVTHTFGRWRKRFLCQEELYVSDNNHQSHYRKTHPRNKGAQFAGSIVADMTFLKDEGHIQLQPPSEYSADPAAPFFWSVKFQLVMIVDGRNLRYEARWPAPNDDKSPVQNQMVYAKGQICIAAAFKPGTA